MEPADGTRSVTRRGPYLSGLRRRQEIVARTTELVAEQGVTRASLRVIADRIGIAHATVRHHFATREQLLLEVLRQAEARADRLAGDAGGDEGSSLAALTGLERETPGLLHLHAMLVARAVEDPRSPAREVVADRYAGRREAVADLLRQGIRSGAVPDDLAVDATAALVVAVADGLRTQRALDPSVDVDAALRVLDRAAGAAPGPAAPRVEQTQPPLPSP